MVFNISEEHEQAFIDLGYSACDLLAQGHSQPMAVYYLWTDHRTEFDWHASDQLAQVANKELC